MSLLRFRADGLVVEERDSWAQGVGDLPGVVAADPGNVLAAVAAGVIDEQGGVLLVQLQVMICPRLGNFATEVKDAGNRWAHGDAFSADDSYRTLVTMERLLTTAIGAVQQAGEVRSLRLDLQQSVIGAATPSTDTHAARPDPPTLKRSERNRVLVPRGTRGRCVGDRGG